MEEKYTRNLTAARNEKEEIRRVTLTTEMELLLNEMRDLLLFPQTTDVDKKKLLDKINIILLKKAKKKVSPFAFVNTTDMKFYSKDAAVATFRHGASLDMVQLDLMKMPGSRLNMPDGVRVTVESLTEEELSGPDF